MSVIKPIISNWRLWLFRILVAVAAILVLISFSMPWWTCTISEVPEPDAIRIYGWGLRHSLVELRPYIEEDKTPYYQTVLAWFYIAISIGVIILSTWLRGNKGRWLLGGVGLIYIIYAAVAAFIVITGRWGDVGLELTGERFSLQGWNSIPMVFRSISLYSTLRFGYYLAYVAGGLCIILALLRNRIIGKKISA